MAVNAPAVQEKTRSFSLRNSLAPALSTRRRNSISSKDAEKLVMPQKIEPIPPLPPLNTDFPAGSQPKLGITTTAMAAAAAVLPSATNAPATSPFALDAAPGAWEKEAVVADSVEVEPRTPSTPTITLSNFAKMPENMGDASYQRFGPGGSSSGPGANRVLGDAKSSPRASRSPSPSSRDDRSSSRDEDESTKASSISSNSPTVSSETKADSPDGTAPLKLTRSDTGGKRPRRLSLFSRKESRDPPTTEAPPVPALPPSLAKSASTERVPATGGAAKLRVKEVKDEMWEAFKTLEADYQKFSSKSGAQKANIIRQCLLPFLRKYEGKASTNITPEILEKRARTLHRWWTGLVAQLRNRNSHASQAMAGFDRPIYLESIELIMSRPEWRTAPSSYAPLAQRIPLSAKSASSASLSSTASSFSLQKSVEHNIKVLFTRTLFDTLAYVVEKMAMRAAPPPLVAFAGKVIAYAFFFCTGVAEMLIGLWGLQPSTVRRVLPEFGIARSANLRQISEDIVCEFPETLHTLGFTTLVALTKQLKRPIKVPIGIQVDWYGPWINRWCGRDSELLFVFIKHYHMLMFEYMPSTTTTVARICAPGYVHVAAQMLTLIDNSIHRSPIGSPEASTSSTTFDDLLNATAALPLPPRGVTRITAENKLVVLTRDMLFGGSLDRSGRECYAISFAAMLKAAVKRTSLHDADACFQLCELVEELFPILAHAEKQGLGEVIDWSFWLEMAQTMMKSENNMTELRVISFVYTTWDILAADEERKKAVCMDWLLSEPIWNRFFCHWSPMVRAYYMRLLVWRLGRYNGDATEVDVEIFKTVLLRLRTGYAHHVRMKEDFDHRGGKPSSTAPCLPAPGRRLVILRNDTMAPSGVILDGIIPTAAPFVATPGSLLHANASTPSLAESDSQSDTTSQSTSSDEVPVTPRRWTFRGMFGFKSATPEQSTVRRGSTGDVQPKEKHKPQTLTSFKFSLEWMDRPPASRDRVLGITRLPSAAQRYLESLGVEIPAVEEMPLTTIDSPHWTYVGRALAEWVMVLVEHESFFERRKTEGRETDKDVETPSLGVDSMRKF